MSAQDMRDMLGLTGEAPRPSKKRKVVEKRPHEKGMAREVSALMGERAPPVSMIQVQPKYKQRPKRHVKVTPWKWTPFTNNARSDDLQLCHWQKASQSQAVQQEVIGTDDAAAPEQAAEPVKAEEQPYQFSRFNVQPDVPTYSDEVYESILKDEHWSKEETDYLLDVIRDFGHRWAIVWDRYEYTPRKQEDGETPSATAPSPAPSRSVEDLKARYYTVKAKMLAHNTPIASMNGTQYSLYQTLTSFDPKQETGRKRLTEAHLYRSEAEVQEETALLAELQRIMINQTSLETSRRDLRERLDYPTSATTTQYTTSQALAQLFTQLVAADRSKKDRRLKDLAGGTSSSGATSTPTAHHRDSISVAPSKRARDSLASVPPLAPDTPDSRSHTLDARAAQRYFVSTHDRLSSGVTFASDKLSKPRVAKSAVQTERIAAVLAHLRIPDAIPLPTQRVIEEFDKVMSKVAGLLEMRKVSEREEGEVRVREAEVGLAKRRKEDGSPEEREGNRGTKRSASVLSAEAGEGREKRRK